MIMKKMKGLTMVSVFALASAITPSIHAWGGQRGCGERHARMLEELNLTGEQSEKLKKIEADFQKMFPGKKQAMKTAHQELANALQGTASAAEVRKTFNELQKKQDEFAQARFDKILAIRELLTPEQRAKFNVSLGHRQGGCGMHKWQHKGRHKGMQKGDPAASVE